MSAPRRLSRSLPPLLSKPPNANPNPPLDPTLSISHLQPLPFPSLPTATTSASLLRHLRRIRHHPRLSPHDLSLLLAAASSSPHFRPDHHLTSHLASHLAATRRLAGLHRLLRLLLSRPCPCSDSTIFSCPHLLPTFRTALLAFAASGDIAAACDSLAALRRAADSPLAVDLYNIVLHALSRRRRHDETLQFYDQMVCIHRARPDPYTFNILIDSSCRVHGVDAAMRWFAEMSKWNCRPNAVSFNTLMRGFFREKRFKEGVRVAREMLEMGTEFSVASMEILINGLCKCGEVEEAVRVFLEFLEDGVVPEGFDCLGLVEGLCRDGRAEKAVEVAELVFEKGRGKGSSLSVAAGITLLEWLRKAGMLDEACRIMERMVQEGIAPDTISCNCVFEALCDARRSSDANRLRILASKKGFKADGVTFGILVCGLATEGRRKEGEDVLDEMLDGGFVPNIWTYNRLLDGLHKKNKSSPTRQGNAGIEKT